MLAAARTDFAVDTAILAGGFAGLLLVAHSLTRFEQTTLKAEGRAVTPFFAEVEFLASSTGAALAVCGWVWASRNFKGGPSGSPFFISGLARPVVATLPLVKAGDVSRSEALQCQCK